MKKFLCAAALCAVASAASAESSWDYQYTGFLNTTTQQFEAATTFSGSFYGTDWNTDGVLQLSELRIFIWERAVLRFDEWGYCDNYQWCELNQFSYDLRKGELHFDYGGRYVDDAPEYSFNFNVVAGDTYRWSGSSIEELQWTSKTRFDISPAPVPEPATVWLLGAGLTAVGMAARRRRQG